MQASREKRAPRTEFTAERNIPVTTAALGRALGPGALPPTVTVLNGGILVQDEHSFLAHLRHPLQQHQRR